jgi:drug/metabolite transporter (DMT)-like permease
VGYLLLLAALVGFGMLGIFHKVADHPGCRPKMIALSLLGGGGILTLLYAALFDPKGLHVPIEAWSIGALGGAFAGLALLLFQTGLRYGKISTSWLIINLSMSVPIALSLFLFGEQPNLTKGLGVLLVFAAILMMWWDKRIDLEKSGTDLAEAGRASKSKWLPLMLLAFFCNGLGASSQKLLVEAGAGAYTWQFYIALYGAGFLLMSLLSVRREGFPNRREVATGLVMAVSSVAGNVSLTLALAHHVPGSIAFPVGNGGSLTLVVLAGVLFFHEKVHRVGVAGIVCGISAILVLLLA